MKILFKYQDESPFLMPGYSRYYEVIQGEKHVGMIHLAHRDWRVSDGTMPPYVEMTITPKLRREIEKDAISDVRSGKSAAKRPAEKSEASKAPAQSRQSATVKAEKRRNGKSFNRRKGKG